MSRNIPRRPAPPSEAQLLASTRVARRAKAILAILRTRQLLSLSEEDLCFAVSVVLGRESEGLGLRVCSQYQDEGVRDKQ